MAGGAEMDEAFCPPPQAWAGFKQYAVCVRARCNHCWARCPPRRCVLHTQADLNILSIVTRGRTCKSKSLLGRAAFQESHCKGCCVAVACPCAVLDLRPQPMVCTAAHVNTLEPCVPLEPATQARKSSLDVCVGQVCTARASLHRVAVLPLQSCQDTSPKDVPQPGRVQPAVSPDACQTPYNVGRDGVTQACLPCTGRLVAGLCPLCISTRL